MNTLSIGTWFSDLWNAIKNLFWQGEYSFFDYKYNIEGYNGQDYDGPAAKVYMWICLISIPVLVFLLRNVKKSTVEKYIKIFAIVMPCLEIFKVSWESYFDITTGRGFNKEGLLPIYTCSLFMYCLLCSAFAKGKVKETCTTWLTTIGFVGGMSNVFFIHGLNYYPFFTFGGLYSMFFHYIMVWTALFLVVTGYKTFKIKDIWEGFIPHLIFSCLVIPVNFIFGWDYMQYRTAGGVPLIQDISSKLWENNVGILTAFIMLLVYFVLHALLILLYKYCREGILFLKKKCKKQEKITK